MNDDHTVLGPSEREAIIESVISSQALAGITVLREMAERLLDEVLCEPLPDIGAMGEGVPPDAR